MLLLRAADIAQACPMKEAIDAVRDGFVALSAGAATVPVRSSVPLAAEGVALTMPAALAGGRHFSVKVVTVVPRNAARGLPLVQAAVLLGDSATGLPLALLDGTGLTALRTGAAGAVAAGALARRGSQVAAVFGAGVQARAQILGLATALSGTLHEIRVVGRGGEGVGRIVDWALEQPELRRVTVRSGSTVDRASWVEEAVADADVVVTATSSEVPVFPGRLLSRGVHITAVGSFKPTMRELDHDAMRDALVVVDQREAALGEAGELEGLRADQVVEIGEVLSGQAPGRSDETQRTVFKSVGNAVQDLVVASRAYDRATRLGLGQEIPWP